MPLILARRWLVNLLLAGLAAWLALLALGEHRRVERAGRLTPLDPGRIERIERHRPDTPPLLLERADGQWWMREPIAAPADADAVGRLLPIAAAQSSRALPAAAADLERLGLGAPAIRLTLDGLELRFGATEPIADRRYAQVGDLVHLVEDRDLAGLLTPVPDLLSRRLLPPGFSPGLGSIDGRPLSADALADLVGVEAERVEPLGGELSGHLLRIESADAGAGLRFLVADGGTRWSRLDQRLTWLFRTPPLLEADEDAALEMPPAAGTAAPTTPAPIPDGR
jgi:hypothetical protein